jgi:putative membrane protein
VIADALYAYLHFAAILGLAAGLFAEALLLRAAPGAATLRAVGRADLVYGVSAGLVLATGLARVFFGAKGAAFYVANPVFWTKMGLFVLLGLLSIPPTVRILRWNRLAKADASFVPAPGQVGAVRRLVLIELHLLALVPLAAVLMARAIGV